MKKNNATRNLAARMRPRRLKKTFASKVKSVIAQTAEKKRITTDPGTFSVTNNALGFTTWNLLTSLVQGTGTDDRIGDKIHLTHCRLRLQMENVNNTGTVVNSDIHYRIVLFRGKYDYTLSSYPGGEVFEANAGGIPSNYVLSPIDLDQVTPLYDKIVKIQAPQYAGQLRGAVHEALIPINKTFNFREDDAFGKTSNLYLGVAQINANGAAARASPTVQMVYTDV